ncbi:hypothetical protein BDV95DRAFT_584351 [Massariosphaeria phaeospora]|uniref:Macro domain-containing protein n=1 Tax=Massariosphaeria phaeospora TaxID=100035 RepID=A0A7C8I6T4_9PLEO|nr:hypothetical protein BDV95DRAFT_584351 [Massariosphaeria phaeospora]
MATIRLGAASDIRAFQSLVTALASTSPAFTNLLDGEALEDEFGRFRVWSGNLGALQKGHSSLDYRLRDSPLLSSNTLKLLQELHENLSEANAILSGSRLPYEQQPKPNDTEAEDDDDFFSDDEDDDSETAPKTELESRFHEIVDIIDNLYKLSVRIRTPTIRSRSLRAASYQPKDPDTGVDLLDQYATLDFQHTKELVHHLRSPHVAQVIDEDDVLISRLGRAITLRRRQFKYWKRHRDKLGLSTVPDDFALEAHPATPRPELPYRHDNLELPIANPNLLEIKDAASERTGKTLLSGTEVTQHHQSLDDIVDSKSVTSYATTVRDLTGRGIDLPNPPKGASGDKDFECPYCFIICPGRYGQGRSWRTHLLQDLQPYLCTYADCKSPDLLFRSRREWSEHESSHRKAWRCPEHPNAVFRSQSGLENHLLREHEDSFQDHQLQSIVKVGETSTVDLRETCPICYAPANMEGLGGFQNHIAHHLERIAAFALPGNTDDDSDAGSSAASRGRGTNTGSQDLSEVSLQSEGLYEEAGGIDSTLFNYTIAASSQEKSASGVDSSKLPGQDLLFAEALGNLPDSTQERLEVLLTTDEFDEASSEVQEDLGEKNVPSKTEVPLPHDGKQNDESRLPILSISDIPTLRLLYKSRKLLQRDQSYAPNDAHNQVVSFCYYDLTRLKVDAIVNSANRAMNVDESESETTLNYHVHDAAGPALKRELETMGRVENGQVVLTFGHELPAQYIIHAASPNYRPEGMGKFNLLTECYRAALKMAMSRGFKTIAFPCISAGFSGFPPRVAARVALQEVRDFLDVSTSYKFERVVFCVYNEQDEKAYKDFLPVFFPPTHGNLENALPAEASQGHRLLAAQLRDIHNQTQVLATDLVTFSANMAGFPRGVLGKLSSILTVLCSVENQLLAPVGLKGSITHLNRHITSDVNLICGTLQTMCGSVEEVVEMGKYRTSLAQSSSETVWDDFELHMKSSQGMDLMMLLEICHDFIQNLHDILARSGSEPSEMSAMRRKLTIYRQKLTGTGDDHNRGHFEEILYSREFQREATTPNRKDIIQLHQIPSISSLYKLGELDQKPTYAIPSSQINHMVCLLRDDITNLQVDVICNSTDVSFSGSGTLDRTIFIKGGPSMQHDCESFGTCNEGDVKQTAGYLLPAKYVLHTIPPDSYRKSTKDILRKLYREVLYTASSLKARSIALPAIGTGMLNYPMRDGAALAMEEVKRFLESAEPNNTLQKIIFCVFSSNGEFVYKSLLPVYFPPLDMDANKALPFTTTLESPDPNKSTDDKEPRRRTLFSSVGEAFRNVRSGKQPVEQTFRSLNNAEEHTLISFETHVRDCPTCSNGATLSAESRTLCESGCSLAQLVLRYLSMETTGTVYSTNLQGGERVEVELPSDFPFSKLLLSSVAHSLQDNPFASLDQIYPGDKNQSQPSPGDNAEITVPTVQDLERATAKIRTWDEHTKKWELMWPDECSILMRDGKLEAYRPGEELQGSPIVSLWLPPYSGSELRKGTLKTSWAIQIKDWIDEPKILPGLPEVHTKYGILLETKTEGEITSLQDKLSRMTAGENFDFVDALHGDDVWGKTEEEKKGDQSRVKEHEEVRNKKGMDLPTKEASGDDYDEPTVVAGLGEVDR